MKYLDISTILQLPSDVISYIATFTSEYYLGNAPHLLRILSDLYQTNVTDNFIQYGGNSDKYNIYRSKVEPKIITYIDIILKLQPVSISFTSLTRCPVCNKLYMEWVTSDQLETVRHLVCSNWICERQRNQNYKNIIIQNWIQKTQQYHIPIIPSITC